MCRTVTIHQPNYLPWLGFFDKMAQADVFVLLDTVAFTKGGYQNRTRIRVPEGEAWLTVPVLTKGRLGQPTREVEVNAQADWQQKHLRTLEQNYRKAAFFDTYWGELSARLSQPWTKLTPLNIRLIEWVRAKLGVGTQLVLASTLGVSGKGTALLRDLCVALGAECYLSGPSGRKYLDEQLFEKSGIEVAYHEFIPRPYRQCFEGFVGGLSAVDYLLNTGADEFQRHVLRLGERP